MKFIDLFAGAGGVRLGMERVGHECVWSCEIDRWCQAVYRHHWGQVEAGDARRVDPATIPDHDLLCAGFPCQSFSIAGERRGFEDTRGTLFYEICRIARAKRPQMLLLENVKGLLSADDRQAFKVVLESLGELGYDVEWQVLNSKDFGVPQNRERVFVVGHLGGLRGREVFPIGGDGGVAQKEDGEQGDREVHGLEISAALDSNYPRGPDGKRTYIAEEPRIIRWQNKREGAVMDDTAPSLRASGGTDIRKRPVVIVEGKPMIVDTKKVGEPRFYDIAPTLQSNDYKEPLKVVEGKPFMIHNVYGGFGEKEPRVFKEHSPTIRTPKGGGHLPHVVEPMILSKVGRGREYKLHEDECTTLRGMARHNNVPMVLNATNPHSKTEERRYHLGDEVRALKGPSGNQRALIVGNIYPSGGEAGAIHHPDGIFSTVKQGKRGGKAGVPPILDGVRIRRLTPRECERLQGFPDDWTRWGVDNKGNKIEISDTQRYKMMGNAVTVNVVEFIAKRLQKHLRDG